FFKGSGDLRTMKSGKAEQIFFGAIGLLILGAAVIAASLVLAIPVAIGAGVYFWIRWKIQQPPTPPPMPEIVLAAEARTIAANFPDRINFSESFTERLMKTWDHQLPCWPMFERMIVIAAEIYAMEALYNPIPPLVSADPIEQGRYRDTLNKHIKKITDAPLTL